MKIVQGILLAWQRFAYVSNSNDYKSALTKAIKAPAGKQSFYVFIVFIESIKS